MSEPLQNSIIALIIASTPGIIVALFTYLLSLRQAGAQARRLVANARVLLSMEIENNRQALDTFWREINAFADDSGAEAPQSRLAGMAAGGMLGYSMPHWSFTRYERIFPQVVATLSAKEVAEIDQAYRDLRTITDLFTKMVTLLPEERKLLDSDRFWYNRYAGMRSQSFARLSALVSRLTSWINPMAQDIAS